MLVQTLDGPYDGSQYGSDRQALSKWLAVHNSAVHFLLPSANSPLRELEKP